MACVRGLPALAARAAPRRAAATAAQQLARQSTSFAEVASEAAKSFVLPIELRARTLNRNFAAVVEGSPQLTPALLRRPDVGARLRELWLAHGVVIIRGLTDLVPEDLAAISRHFGALSDDVGSGRSHATLPGVPVLRIGNVAGPDGRLVSVPSSSKGRALSSSGSCRYRPEDRLPVWHTDGLFLGVPPAGSALFCRQAPDEGGETCFADSVAAWESLSEKEKKHLEGLECICSLAHHDAKLNKRVPNYPTLTPEERAANPPRRVPVVLDHPVTGRRGLYGMNSGTCKVVPRGQPVDAAEMDRFDLLGEEHESVSILRDLLPRMTGEEFAVVWPWRAGDLVIWDNRSSIHAATGYDQDRYTREMWRTTILPE